MPFIIMGEKKKKRRLKREENGKRISWSHGHLVKSKDRYRRNPSTPQWTRGIRVLIDVTQEFCGHLSMEN